MKVRHGPGSRSPLTRTLSTSIEGSIVLKRSCVLGVGRDIQIEPFIAYFFNDLNGKLPIEFGVVEREEVAKQIVTTGVTNKLLQNPSPRRDSTNPCYSLLPSYQYVSKTRGARGVFNVWRKGAPSKTTGRRASLHRFYGPLHYNVPCRLESPASQQAPISYMGSITYK